MCPHISLLFTCYNCIDYLPDTIQSLQAQSYQDWEAIFVDDASTVGNIQTLIAKLNDPRIRTTRHTVNKGAGAGFNTAFSLSTTPIIMIHGADDLLAPDYVQKALAVLDAHPDIDLVFPNYQLFGAKSAEWKYTIRDMADFATLQWIPAGCAFRRALWERSGGHYEGPELRHGNIDWDFFLSIVESGPLRVKHIDEALYLYRQHSTNMSNKRSYNEHITRECMYKRHKKFIDAQGRGAGFLFDGYVEAADASWKKGEKYRAGTLAQQAVTLIPFSSPALPTLKLSVKQAVNTVARLTLQLEAAGVQALAVTPENIDTRLTLAALYIFLGKHLEAREQFEILLGHMIGNKILQPVPDILLMLMESIDPEKDAQTLREALHMALQINPLHAGANLCQLRQTLAAKRPNQAIHIARQLAERSHGSQEALEVLGTMFVELHNNFPTYAKSLQTRMETSYVAPPLPQPSDTPLIERIYDSALGRRLHWSYRAKDLFETYGHLRGGFDVLTSVLQRVKPQRILEIGCGNGRNLVLFAEHGLECVGQEISASALELAKARQLAHVTLVDTPVPELPYAEGYFDLAVSNRVLQHIPDAEARQMDSNFSVFYFGTYACLFQCDFSLYRNIPVRSKFCLKF
ncbi:MAG: glycosyltransferase, partial [Desulfovibrionaceae bacterium]